MTPGFTVLAVLASGRCRPITSDDQRTEKRAVAGHKINTVGRKLLLYPNAAVGHQFNETDQHTREEENLAIPVF